VWTSCSLSSLPESAAPSTKPSQPTAELITPLPPFPEGLLQLTLDPTKDTISCSFLQCPTRLQAPEDEGPGPFSSLQPPNTVQPFIQKMLTVNFCWINQWRIIWSTQACLFCGKRTQTSHSLLHKLI
jgi:hypothetical protein